MSEALRIIIVAGPNGAGKPQPRVSSCRTRGNANLIAAGLSPFNPEAAALRAGRLMLEEMATRIAQARSFAFETRLSGIAYARQIADWRRGRLNFLNLTAPPPTTSAPTAWSRTGPLRCAGRNQCGRGLRPNALPNADEHIE